jgi:hypothetical protein
MVTLVFVATSDIFYNPSLGYHGYLHLHGHCGYPVPLVSMVVLVTIATVVILVTMLRHDMHGSLGCLDY